MNNHWFDIWSNKGQSAIEVNTNEFQSYCALKKADGFDVAVNNETVYFMNFYKGFLASFDKMKALTGKEEFSSVFEVGCGSGVNLYLLRSRLAAGAYIGGLDYSQEMINLASKTLPEAELYCGDATSLPTKPKVDIVMADSVFQYFGSLEYAKETLNKMFAKANDLVFLGEIHNAALYDEWLDNRRKTIADYDEKYKSLKKLFFSKEWLETVAEDNGRKVFFEDINNEEYLNSRYIFNTYFY